MPRTRNELPDPAIFREFPFNIGYRLLAPGDVRPTAAQRDAYRRFTRLGDPLADGVAAMFRRLPAGEGRRMFEVAVERGIDAVDDAPEELVAFFAHVDAVPYWVDEEKLALAARVTARTGPWGAYFALPGLALMGGYLASRADKTLMGSGNLTEMAPRRLAETANWWLDVTSPGGLERFAPGFKGILRVRLMHALVRAGMNRRPDWNYDEWDHPVNQSQTVGTLMLFSLANIIGCQALGLRFSPKEKAAVYHFWRYVGLLLGLDPEIVPTDERDTWRLFWLQADYEFLPDDDSRKLAQALLSAGSESLTLDDDDAVSRTVRRLFTNYFAAYSRLILGRSNANFLGLPDSKAFQAAVLLTAAANRAAEIPRQFVPGATWASEVVGQRVRQHLIRRFTAITSGDNTYSRHDTLGDARNKRRDLVG
jgi:ER-bound oxygenase mpaB/B'/Rubber oxygenase, catalytic domain